MLVDYSCLKDPCSLFRWTNGVQTLSQITKAGISGDGVQTWKFSEAFRMNQMCRDENLWYKVKEKSLYEEGLSDRPGYGLVEFLKLLSVSGQGSH